MSSIQADHRSPLGSWLTPLLLMAIDNAQSESLALGSYPDLSAVAYDKDYDRVRMHQVRAILAAWGDQYDYDAASGVDLDTNQPLPLEQPDAAASQATAIFNAWLVRLLARTFGDEMVLVGEASGSRLDLRGLLHLTSTDPANLATYDPATKDSALWDDLTTPDQLESRQERMVRALLDALSWLDEKFPGGLDEVRWGMLHTVRFNPSAPVFGELAIPPTNDPVFAGGFPRHGDMYVVDASNFSTRKTVEKALNFTYGSGPNQRFVIDLDPAGPKARNALPGGASGFLDDPHFSDQAERWRRNQTHDVPFALGEVLGAAERRTTFTPER